MKRKKLLSAAVAGMLVTAQMVMPVMAADSGQVEVDVATKTAVIRVEVPTKLSVAVDQFEMENGGTQIYSEAFTMKNLSEIDVKVSVESTATLKATTKLLATKDDAVNSTKEGEAWLAVAAQSKLNDYDDPTTDTSDADASPAVSDTPETVATLTQANKNVATFVQGTDANATKGTVKQEFYLKKGTGAVGYKLLNAGEDASQYNYAQFYLLTVIGSDVFDGSGDDAALQAKVNSGDVYSITTDDIADNASLTLIEKGTDGVTYTNTNTYYTVADEPTAKASLDPAKLYVYGGTSGAAAPGTGEDTAGEAAFRYIGKLSGKQESWTDEDISKIDIVYTIVGVTSSRYDEVKEDCTYGLYYASAPVSALSSKTISAAANSITVTGATVTKVTLVKTNGTEAVCAVGTNYTFANGTLQVTASMLANNVGGKLKIELSTGSTEEVTIQ